MIPKIIHYCWFGKGKLPKQAQKCIQSWRKFFPGYQIKKWDEDNFDIASAVPYVQEAYKHKKYAFVSDYVRLYALYTEGGIYFDTDVEVLKPMNDIIETNKFIMGFEDRDKLSTAVIASSLNVSHIKVLLDDYSIRHFVNADGDLDLTTNVVTITKYFESIGLKLNNTEQCVDEIHFFPADYFSPQSWESGKYRLTANTYTIHFFAGTWHTPIVKFLSLFFTNATILRIAGLKEKMKKWVKRCR